ncbi:MAG: hypothetical protein A3A58_01675 [Candidatus Blackburnbacteria bacterium RIFCSPLOWO2_01_FULL_41_27]|uniref:Uncharacterized protein n=2 Tax=Candidatus Blackburniibacteriota TaxID=1817898 RepID=A0A1G1V7F8_9BACT|nr:MAG: hypothetical protein A3F61_03640 [Candidatus Blackburnbacteria bacterium RIFCSPHIGHO2_12_FULL_41_13b]OGY14549.1 MAG: hypothetical protein A3A58_01675 [Candidatus Blackburnbacteria bacterium RIFCSPLOWO2_01_FULL_41_27]
MLGLLPASDLWEQKSADIDSLMKKIRGAFHEGKKKEFIHANSVYKAKEVLELLFSVDNEESFVRILSRLEGAARRAEAEMVHINPDWEQRVKHISPSMFRHA